MNVALLVMPDASATASICAMTSLTFMGASDLVSFVTPMVCGSGGIWTLGGIVVVMAASRVSICRIASR